VDWLANARSIAIRQVASAVSDELVKLRGCSSDWGATSPEFVNGLPMSNWLDGPTLAEVSRVISFATAPAFLLGTVAASRRKRS
jgi:hypothetical protein